MIFCLQSHIGQINAFTAYCHRLSSKNWLQGEFFVSNQRTAQLNVALPFCVSNVKWKTGISSRNIPHLTLLHWVH